MHLAYSVVNCSRNGVNGCLNKYDRLMEGNSVDYYMLRWRKVAQLLRLITLMRSEDYEWVLFLA